jgi:hypothetical protein
MPTVAAAVVQAAPVTFDVGRSLDVNENPTPAVVFGSGADALANGPDQLTGFGGDQATAE